MGEDTVSGLTFADSFVGISHKHPKDRRNKIEKGRHIYGTLRSGE